MESASFAEATKPEAYQFTTPEALLADIALTQGRVDTSMTDLRTYRERKQGDKSMLEEGILDGLLDHMVELRAVARANGVELGQPKQAEQTAEQEQPQAAGKTTVINYGESEETRAYKKRAW